MSKSCGKKLVGEPEKLPAGNQPNKEFFTYASFGGVLGVCATTIQRMCAKGLLKRVVLGPRIVRIPVSELHRLRAEAV